MGNIALQDTYTNPFTDYDYVLLLKRIANVIAALGTPYQASSRLYLLASESSLYYPYFIDI